MSRFKIVNLIDKVFVTTAIFLIVFAWINFYVKDLWATFIMSIIFSFAIVFLLYYFLGKKQTRKTMSKQELTEMQNCFFAFRLLTKNEQLKLIKELTIKEKNLTQKDICLSSKKLKFKDSLGNHLVIIATNLTKINDDNLINLINENFEKQIDCYDIFCNEVEAVHADMLKNKKINFINHKSLYGLLKKYNLCPSTENLNQNVTKIKFKDIAKTMFWPNKAKSYFLCGLILIFSSIIIPHHLYYIIFGSTLLLFAIICKILPKISK